MRLLIMVLWPLGSSVAPFSIYICRGATKRHQQTSPRTRPRASRIAHFFLVSGALSASMYASFVPVPVCGVLRPAADELRPPSLARNTSAPPYSHAARRPAFFLVVATIALLVFFFVEQNLGCAEGAALRDGAQAAGVRSEERVHRRFDLVHVIVEDQQPARPQEAVAQEAVGQRRRAIVAAVDVY